MSIIDHNVKGLNKAIFFNTHLLNNNNNNGNGNYSSGVSEFAFTNDSTTQTLFISQLNIKIQDDGKFNLNEYGNIGTTLVNGINIYYTGSTGTDRKNIIGLTYPIQKNGDYFNYTTDINVQS